MTVEITTKVKNNTVIYEDASILYDLVENSIIVSTSEHCLGDYYDLKDIRYIRIRSN